MKIALRGMGSHDLMAQMERAGISALVGGIHDRHFFDSFWPNADLAGFLRTAALHGSVDLNPWMVFEAREIAQSRFLRIRPKKVLTDAPADFARMRAAIDRLPWRGEDVRRRFRVPDHLYLSAFRLKPNQVAQVGQWSAEYVVSKSVRALVEQARFTGVEFRPVTHPRTDVASDDYFHLYSDHTLGLRELDLASPMIDSPHPEERGFDALGCLCYDPEKLTSALDLNRTGEQLVSFEFPEWVVRASVKEWFQRHRLRGWAFEPIVELGTAQYDDYCKLWSSLYDLLMTCKVHTVRSRRPVSGHGLTSP